MADTYAQSTISGAGADFSGLNLGGGTPAPAPVPVAPSVGGGQPKPNIAPKATAPTPAAVPSSSRYVFNSGVNAFGETYAQVFPNNAPATNAAATTLNNANKTDTSNVVTSSAPVVQQEQNTAAVVSSLNPPNTTTNADGSISPDTQGATDASAAYMKTLDDYTATLEARRKEETDQINKDYEAQKVIQQNAQDKETGSTSVMLQRTGGYLGESGSATGVLLNLAQTHSQEMTALMGKRDAAIQAANTAITDKEFAVAQAKATEVKALDQEINKRKQDFFDNMLKITQEQRSQDTFQQSKVKDDLANLSYLDPTAVPDSKKQEIDSFYGVPGFTDKYLAVTNATKLADSQAKQITAKKDLVDLLQNIPQGQKVTFPDGTTYTGLGKIGDTVTWMQVDDAGVGHIIAYNKATGQQVVTSAGHVGKTKTQSSTTVVDPRTEDNATALMQIRLEQSKGQKDGLYDPQAYIRERELIKQAYPSLVPKMDAKFLNKSNGFFSDDAINYLRKQGVFVNNAALADTPGNTQVINNNVTDTSDNSIGVGQ